MYKRQFRLVEINATNPGDVADPGFQGVLMSFRQLEAFSGRTVIAEDRGVYNPTTLDLMPRIEFPDQNFEKMFEVYSDDEEATRLLFTHDFIEKMTVFSRQTMGQDLQSCWVGDEIHFALNIGERFAFSKVSEAQTIEHLKKELLIEAGQVCMLLEKLFSIQASIGSQDDRDTKAKRLSCYKSCLEKMLVQTRSLNFDQTDDEIIAA